MNKWAVRTGGFVAAAGAVIVLEVMIIAIMNSGGYRFYPKGIGWIIAPVAAGFFGAAWADRNAITLALKSRKAATATPTRRFIVAISICWLMVIGAIFILFEPLGRYWGSDDWAFFWKILLIPPVLLAASLFILGKFGVIKNYTPEISEPSGSIDPPRNPRPELSRPPAARPYTRTMSPDELSQRIKAAQERLR